MGRQVTDEGFVYLSLLADDHPEPVAGLRWTRDLGRSLYQAHYRGRRQLVVAAVNCGPDRFEYAADVELPWGAELQEVAARFGRMSLAAEAERHVFQQALRLDGAVRRRLGGLWSALGGVLPPGLIAGVDPRGRIARETMPTDADDRGSGLNRDAYLQAWDIASSGHGVSIIDTWKVANR